MADKPPSLPVAIPPSTYEPEGDVVTQHEGLTLDEKRTLLVLVMEDIRGAFDLGAGDRTQAVLDLATELGYEQVREHAQAYRDDDGYRDGRHFRCPFSEGGYEDPPFPVTRSKSEASAALVAAVDAICEYPEYRLDDADDGAS